jgi:transcriptional regulator with XRE-family HTH domain
MTASPRAKSTEIGVALRIHRETAGYRLEDAAMVLECDKSKISRLETGRRGIRARDLRELLKAYDVPESRQQELIRLLHALKPPRGG